MRIPTAKSEQTKYTVGLSMHLGPALSTAVSDKLREAVEKRLTTLDLSGEWGRGCMPSV